jgi:hypothetical protein
VEYPRHRRLYVGRARASLNAGECKSGGGTRKKEMRRGGKWACAAASMGLGRRFCAEARRGRGHLGMRARGSRGRAVDGVEGIARWGQGVSGLASACATGRRGSTERWDPRAESEGERAGCMDLALTGRSHRPESGEGAGVRMEWAKRLKGGFLAFLGFSFIMNF